MPADYDRHGIRFQYPENWLLEDRAGEDELTVAVYSPGGAFWSLALYPTSVGPARLADDALAALRDEYDNLDAEPVRDVVAGQSMGGYNIDFIHLDLVCTALVRTWTSRSGTFVIHCQAEDREFARLEAVFHAITTSLLADQRVVR
jgi:hypothetical protein